MAEWLEQVSQWHELYSHDLEVMSRVELGVCSTSVLSHTWTKNILHSANCYAVAHAVHVVMPQSYILR